MNFTQLNKRDETSHLPFADQIEISLTDDKETYLINDQSRAIGFIQLIKEEEDTYRLKKFSIQQPDEAEKIIDIFHHILRFVKEKSAKYLTIKTDQESVQTLVYLLGFERHLDLDNTFTYTYN